MNRFKNILYVSEASAAQDAAIARAASLAQNNQAQLTVIAVVPPATAKVVLPPGGPVSAELQTVLVEERRKALESLIEPHRQGLNIRLDVLIGNTFLEVIRAVLRNCHDLVIKPAENPGWLDRLFGSDDMHLLRKCPCPVWLMKPGEMSNYECILAAVDFDASQPDSAGQPLNREILALAASLALSDFAALHLVHAWDAPAEMLLRTWSDNPDEAVLGYVDGERSRHQDGMNKLRDMLRERTGGKAYEYLAPNFHVLQGSAKKIIPELATRLHADLVVMGTVARTGISGFIIGNTAEAILDQLTCSVLALKPPGFVSPVKLDE